MDQNKWVLEQVTFVGVSDAAQWAVTDWYQCNFGTVPNHRLPSYTVKHGISIPRREIVFLIADESFHETPLTTVALVENEFLDSVFTFRGTVYATHLSRSGKSVVILTEEPKFLNGDPWIIYHTRRYILTLDGDVRNQ